MRLEILTPHSGGFVLGRSLLGVGTLGAPGALESWLDVLEHASTLTYSRGGTTGKLNELDAGRLSATFKAIDPEVELWLRVGRAVRVIDDERVGEPVLWEGVIEDATTDTGEDYDLTVLVAVDPAAPLTKTKPGAVGGAGGGTNAAQTLRERVRQVLGRSSARLRFIGDDTPRELRPNAHTDATSAEQLTVACNSVAGCAWRAAVDGTVEVVTGLDTRRPVLTFTDAPTSSSPSYKALTLAYGTAEGLTNTLEVTNWGGTAATGAADIVTTHTDVTSVATYGRREGTVELSLDVARVPYRAAELLADTATVARTPTKLTYRYRDVPELELDLLDVITVVRRASSWPAIVVGQAHTFNVRARTHDVELTLKAGAAGGDLDPAGTVYDRPWIADGFNGLFDALGTVGGTVPYVNPAGTHVTVAQSTTSAGRGADRALDHANDGDHIAVTSDTGGRQEWWAVDFGPGRQVIPTRFGLLNHQGSNDLPQLYRIEGSNDGASWDLLGRPTSPASANEWRSTPLADAGAYRHLRVQLDYVNSSGTGYLVIGEVEVWGQLIETPTDA